VVTFDVGTNVFAISVHGESKALKGKVRVREGADGLQLEQLEAIVPVESLNTGMKLRDGHMRKYIFQTPEGQVPDVRFSAEHADCSAASTAGQSTCKVSGTLAIRGTPRPFVIDLLVNKESDLFRVRGDALVRLSTYGIERPSQFGVQTADDVKLHLELNARSAPIATLSSSAKR
jgi:polyisoprenoid-binding protein YceI